MESLKRAGGEDKMKVLNVYHKEHNGQTSSALMIISWLCALSQACILPCQHYVSLTLRQKSMYHESETEI